MKKIKRKNNIAFLWIIYIILLIVCILLTNATNGDIASAVINAALFIIVCIIFCLASRNLLMVNKITKALDKARAKIGIDYNEKHFKMLLNDYRNNKSETIFSGTLFEETFSEYLYEVNRLATDDECINNCDINDYINKEAIDSTAHKNMLNLITGVMTGLGILGTFVGLTIGLQNFTTGSAEQIEESIPKLMDGIKVAFHTSIYGMTFSLVFNYVYKQIMEQAYNALDDFIVCFNRYVCADVDNDSNNYIYRSLKTLPEAIGIEIGKQINSTIVELIAKNNDNLSQIDNRIKSQSEIIDRHFENTIIPQMSQMNESLVKLTNNIREDQDETIKKLITLFTEQMNDTLGQSFAELRKVIEETAQIQKQNNEFAEKVLPLIADINESTEQIHELSKNTIEGMSGYVDSINELQSVINQNFVEVGVQLADQAEINERLNVQIENLVGYEKQFADASEKFIADIAQGIEHLGEFEKSIKENAENSIKLLNDTTKSNSEMMTKAVEECTQNISKECSERMNSLVASTSDEMAKMSSTIEICAKNVSDECTSSLEKLENTANEGLVQFKSSIETCTANITEECTSTMKDFVATVKEEVVSINETSENASKDIEKAADRLAGILDNLNENVWKSLKDGLGEFDSIVAQICERLSGTIAEVDAITGKVPRVVDESYRGIEEGFQKLRGQIEALILSTDDMRRTIKEWNEANSR